MNTRIASLLRKLRRGFRAENGTASIEFVIVFPIIMMIFFAGFEGGMLNIRDTMLERSLDLTVRDLRLGHIPNPTNDKLKQDICSRTALLPNCTNVLMLELTPVDTATWLMPATHTTCVDRSAKIQPVTTVEQGSGDEMMMIRACIIMQPLFPLTGIGLDIPKDSGGGYALIATSAFVNEPS